MQLVTKKSEIIENIELLEYYLCEGDKGERKFALDLLKKGACFVVYEVNGEIRFWPSRFLGYKGNSIAQHKRNKNIIDGKETNPAISKVLKQRNLENEDLKERHEEYCLGFGVTAHKRKKSFWDLTAEDAIKIQDKRLESGFPEGALVERIHLRRERNSKVIELAKANFKEKHGRLFCQVCDFDFESVYGELGQDYIEGHHTIAVSEMEPGHETQPEEIAMVCANCHRMLHRKRPWLGIGELKEVMR